MHARLHGTHACMPQHHDPRCVRMIVQDGYCSLASFGEGELGEVMDLGELPPTVAAALRHTHAHNFAARASQKKAVVRLWGYGGWGGGGTHGCEQGLMGPKGREVMVLAHTHVRAV